MCDCDETDKSEYWIGCDSCDSGFMEPISQLHQIMNLKDIFVIVVCRLHFCTVEYFCNSCVLNVELWSSVSPCASPCVCWGVGGALYQHILPH